MVILNYITIILKKIKIKNNFLILIFFFKIIFFNSNYILCLLNNNNYFYNFNLINGLLLIHPFLIYISYFNLFFLLILFKYKYVNYYLIFLNVKKDLIYICIISFFSLFLGGLWAQQEINWGGFWNWDFVEIISIILFIISISFYHIKNNNWKLNENMFNNLIFYSFIFFVVVRFDIINSIHSFAFFNLKQNYIIFINYFIILFFLFFIILKLFLLNKFKLYINNVFNFNRTYKYIILINSVFLTFILFNIFVNYIYNLQFSDINSKIKIILITLMYNFILTFFYKKFDFYFFIINIININIFIISLIKFFKFFVQKNKYYFIHFLVISFLIIVLINDFIVIYTQKYSTLNNYNIKFICNNYFNLFNKMTLNLTNYFYKLNYVDNKEILLNNIGIYNFNFIFLIINNINYWFKLDVIFIILLVTIFIIFYTIKLKFFFFKFFNW